MLWIAIFVLIVMAIVSFFAASYITVPFKGDFVQHGQELADKSNPNHGVIRADFETGRSEARTRLNIALKGELDALESLIRSQYSVHRLMDSLEMEFAEKIALHITNLLNHKNLQSAFQSSSIRGLRLPFYEELIFAIATGELGKTLTEVKRKELLDELELRRLEAENQITFDFNVKLDDWKQKRLKAYEEE